MQTHKYNYSNVQCEGRWKTLERSVKKVSDHNSKSGNDVKTHPYEEQLEFLIERPNIRPSYILGSTIDNENQDSGENEENQEYSSEGESNRSVSPVPPAPTPAKRKRSNVSEVLDALKEHITIQKRRHEENMRRQDVMHQERMTIMKGFLDVFKDMGSKAKNYI